MLRRNADGQRSIKHEALGQEILVEQLNNRTFYSIIFVSIISTMYIRTTRRQLEEVAYEMYLL